MQMTGLRPILSEMIPARGMTITELAMKVTIEACKAQRLSHTRFQLLTIDSSMKLLSNFQRVQGATARVL